MCLSKPQRIVGFVASSYIQPQQLVEPHILRKQFLAHGARVVGFKKCLYCSTKSCGYSRQFVGCVLWIDTLVQHKIRAYTQTITCPLFGSAYHHIPIVWTRHGPEISKTNIKELLWKLGQEEGRCKTQIGIGHEIDHANHGVEVFDLCEVTISIYYLFHQLRHACHPSTTSCFWILTLNKEIPNKGCAPGQQ